MTEKTFSGGNFKRHFIVTTSWDDGQKIDLEVAKLLKKYDMKGTFYLSQHYKDTLDEAEIFELDKEQEIGAHTLNHKDLTKISINEALEEIEGSKKYLEKTLGHQIVMFSYPYGKYNKDIIDIVRNSGFKGGRTIELGDFNNEINPYRWSVTMQANNGLLSPVLTKLSKNLSVKSMFDWEIRAKELFNLFMNEGGIFHLWGHGYEFEDRDEWDKLERVFKYISHKDNVLYINNGKALSL